MTGAVWTYRCANFYIESLYFVELSAEHLSKNDPLFSETSSNPHDWRTDVRYNYGSIFSFLLVPLN